MKEIKINNTNNTYKNRHAEVHTKKSGRPRIVFENSVKCAQKWLTPDEIMKDLIPIRKVIEETGEVIDL